MYDMKTIALATTIGLGLGAFIGAVPAAPASTTAIMAPADSKVDNGSIKSVDAANNRFVMTIRDRDVTIRVNEKTTYTLDGAPSTMEEALKAGANAKVTHEDYMATSVAVSSAKPAPDPK